MELSCHLLQATGVCWTAPAHSSSPRKALPLPCWCPSAAHPYSFPNQTDMRLSSWLLATLGCTSWASICQRPLLLGVLWRDPPLPRGP